MDTTNLILQATDPQTLGTLSLGKQFLGGLVATIFGVGISIQSFGMLKNVIGYFNKHTEREDTGEAETNLRHPAQHTPANIAGQSVVDEELVAAITVALAMVLQTSASRIVVRNIRKINDDSPVWNRVGIIEQMNINA